MYFCIEVNKSQDENQSGAPFDSTPDYSAV